MDTKLSKRNVTVKLRLKQGDIVKSALHRHPLRFSPHAGRCDWCALTAYADWLSCDECGYDICPKCYSENNPESETRTTTVTPKARAPINVIYHQHSLTWTKSEVVCSSCTQSAPASYFCYLCSYSFCENCYRDSQEPQPDELILTTWHKHKLGWTIGLTSHICDRCEKRGSGDFYRCESCDYDICLPCFHLGSLLHVSTPKPLMETGPVSKKEAKTPSQNVFQIKDLSVSIFGFVCEYPSDILVLQLVEKEWNSLCNLKAFNSVWEVLCRLAWPHLRAVTMADWRMFYCKRKEALDDWKKFRGRKAENVPIENCADGLRLQQIFKANGVKFEFKCPVTIDKISRTSNPAVDYCKVCHKHIYLVATITELKQQMDKGLCVAFDEQDIVAERIRRKNRRLYVTRGR